MRACFFKMLAALCWLCGAGSTVVEAEEPTEWGTLTGQFVTERSDDAVIDARIVQKIGRLNNALPRQKGFIDESTRGIENIVLMLQEPTGETYPQPHSDYDRRDDVARKIAIGNPVQPYVALIKTGEPFQLTNALGRAIEGKIDAIKNRPQRILLQPNGVANLQFDEEERLPVSLAFFAPRLETAWLVIRRSPYMAVTDRKGRFRIENLPAGDWLFQAWHERSGYVAEVRRSGETEAWPRGQFQVHIESDKHNLGVIEVPLDQFDKRER